MDTRVRTEELIKYAYDNGCNVVPVDTGPVVESVSFDAERGWDFGDFLTQESRV